MREIGSEFWTGCTPTSGVEYTMRPANIYESHPYKVIETLSGRTALEHIVEILIGQGKKTAYLPSYCCHTMIEPFLKHGMTIDFYNVECSNNGLHRSVDSDAQYDAILLMDYFGHTDNETYDIALNEKLKGKTVIYDATHSLYSPFKTDACDFIYGSYRKWVDINCGFMIWKEDLNKEIVISGGNNQVYASIRQEFFDRKAQYMQGGPVKKEEFLPLIEQAETILEEQYHHKMPDNRSMKVLKTTDATYIKGRRKENARVLTEAINELNDRRVRCINSVLNTFDIPLFVPVIVEKKLRNPLRRFLIDYQIYCPVHWPKSGLHQMMEGSQFLFESELSLICDQRYDNEDMRRIADTIKRFLN